MVYISGVWPWKIDQGHSFSNGVVAKHSIHTQPIIKLIVKNIFLLFIEIGAHRLKSSIDMNVWTESVAIYNSCKIDYKWKMQISKSR